MKGLSGSLLRLSLAVAGALGLAAPAHAVVQGYVDMHSHLMGEHAFGGSWFWGTTEGPINTALARCDGNFGYGPGMGSHGATIFPILSEFLGADTGWHLGRRRGYDNRRCRYFLGIPIPGTCPRTNFEHWPKWDAIAHQQLWWGHLKSAHQRGLQIMGVSLVESEFLCSTTPPLRRRYNCNEMDSIRRQANFVRGFVSRNSDWVGIAETPQQARTLIAQGKLALVLTAELTKLFPEGDYLQQLDEFHALGIRSLQLVHHADNRFSGTAPINHLRVAASAAEYLSGNVINTPINDTICRNANGSVYYYLLPESMHTLPYHIFMLPKCDGEEYLNERGLSDDGKVLVNAMMSKGMLIDVSHMSRHAFRDAYAIAMARGRYPLTYSHTHMWDTMTGGNKEEKHEKYLRSDEISMITDTGGMIGLRTAPEATNTYIRPPMAQPYVANTCQGSSRSFAQSMLYAMDHGLNVGFGVDMNGFITQSKGLHDYYKFVFNSNGLPDIVPGDQCYDDYIQLKTSGTLNDFHSKGLGHIGLLPEFIADLKRVGVPQSYMDRLERDSAETYLQIWERSLQLAGTSSNNLALTATASASSSYCPSPTSPDHCYYPSRVNDGNPSTALGGTASWTNDGYVAMPQWVQLQWSAPVTATRATVVTTSGYPVRDYDLQSWDGSAWRTLAHMVGNTSLTISHTFPAVTTTRMRILGYQGPAAQPGYVRINELEIYP